jgi:hypothetical protein
MDTVLLTRFSLAVLSSKRRWPSPTIEHATTNIEHATQQRGKSRQQREANRSDRQKGSGFDFGMQAKIGYIHVGSSST